MKKVLYTLLAVLLLSTLTLTVATPVMANTPNTDIDISASATELSAPGDITLTIWETNTGAAVLWDVRVYLYENDETDPSNLIATLDINSPYFSGGDYPLYGVLNPGESWRWDYPITVTASTKFIVIGYGMSSNYGPVTYDPVNYPDERAEIDVTVTEDGGEGFTPGYWRNHYEDWAATGYSPEDDFDTVFGVDWYDPDITLEDAIWLGGGGLKALTRHATAALLNAAHPGVDYPWTVEEVIAAVQSVTSVNELLNIFVTFNELGGDL